jgi:hypothetical protein
MKLYFNGCSHTNGDDLVDKNIAWPALIAQHHNCEFLNDSISGGTNDRIVYRTIKHADQFDFFYIAWTYIPRFTRYRNDNNYEVNFNPGLANDLYGKTSEFQQYGKLHYAVWYNELFAFKIWLQNIILLQRFFQSINKPYIMVNADHNNINRWTGGCNEFNKSVHSLLCFDLMNDEQLIAEHKEIQQLITQIDFTHYPGWNTWWITKLHTTYPVGPSKHLLEEGHQAVAQYIIGHANV